MKSRMTEMQKFQSVSNMKQYEPSIMEHTFIDSNTSNINQSRIIKELRIGNQINKSALPPYVTQLMKSTIEMLPIFLFSIFKQFHVIYFIILTAIIPLKFICFAGYLWGTFTLHLVFIVLYIVIECIARYLTYKSFIEFEESLETQYWAWKPHEKKWQQILEKEIKVGQIIKVKQKQNKMMQEESVTEKKIKVSVNILPLYLSSGRKQVQVDTFNINKQQQAKSIQIDYRFEQFFNDEDRLFSSDSAVHVSSLIGNCKIGYLLSNFGNEQFEGLLQFQHLKQEKKISSLDVVTRDTYFCNEDFMIGVAMFSLEGTNHTYLKYLLNKKNRITDVLQNHLAKIILANLVIIVLLLIVNSILSSILFNQVPTKMFHCFVLNYFSVFSFSMNVIMYLFIAIHHLSDGLRISHKSGIKLHNYIKTIDEFGMADAILIDQFTLVKKNILKVIKMDINSEQEDEALNEKVILFLIENSMQFKLRFPKQWVSLSIYYKTKYLLNTRQKKSLSKYVSIKDEMIDISGAVRIFAQFNFPQQKREKSFLIRFNEKIIFSILESISLEEKHRFAEKIEEAKRNGELMIMVEILQIDQSSEIDISVNIYELEYRFFSLIRMQFIRDQTGTDFINELKNQYNIIIMTSSPLQYFDQVLVTAELRDNDFLTIVFQQSEQSIFKRDLENRILQINNNYFINNQSPKNNLIVAIDSSIIAYLAQDDVRESLRKLSMHATYLIFFNTSQFQKELCALNIFKIFPNHIFISNFSVDSFMFRMSSLSVSIEGHSANRYSIISLKSYRQLHKFITRQSTFSIQLTSLLIKNHIFKNQTLIASTVLAMILIYKGSFFQLNLQYSIYLFFIYNFGFTSLPIIYYFLARPQILPGIIIDNFDENYKLVGEHITGIIMGIIMTFITYSFIPNAMAYQLFLNILINCSLMANLYYLVLDKSISKKWQSLTIFIQCIFTVGIIFLAEYLPGIPHGLFTFGVMMSPFQQQNINLYFIFTFVFTVFIIIMAVLFIAIMRQIVNREIQMKTTRRQSESEILITEDTLQKKVIVGKISRSEGRQMRFRGTTNV